MSKFYKTTLDGSILVRLRLNIEDDIVEYCDNVQKSLNSIMTPIVSDMQIISNGLRSLRELEIRNNNRLIFLEVSESAIEAHRYITSTVVKYMQMLVPLLNPTDDPHCWYHDLVPAQQTKHMFGWKGMSERNIYNHEYRLMKAGILTKTVDGRRMLDLNRYEEIVSAD